MNTLAVAEIFHSIQGESTFAGLPCVFVRLAGCNLDCVYCDTPASRAVGTPMTVPNLLDAVSAFGCRLVEITGGEPLLQAGTPELSRALLDAGMTVLVETNGTLPVAPLDPRAVRIVDVKTPASGMESRFHYPNLRVMTPPDQVKFVVGDRADFNWVLAFWEAHLKGLGLETLVSPVTPGLDAATLARWVLEVGVPFRLQVQLHKLLGLPQHFRKGKSWHDLTPP